MEAAPALLTETADRGQTRVDPPHLRKPADPLPKRASVGASFIVNSG